VALEEITIELDGRTLGFHHQPGRGPALLFFHGAGNGALHLRALAEALPGRAVFLLDAPGRGLSEGPALGRVSELAALAVAAMAALGEREWIACGHSLGGAVALECGVLGGPGGPCALVLLATGARLRVSPAIFELVRAAIPSGKGAPTAELAFVETGAEALAAIHALDAAIPPESALADWTAADTFDRMGALGEIEVPCLVVTGTRDPLTPEKYGLYLETHLPRAELVRLEGAGHMLPVERAEETARAIGAFVDSLATQAQS
jgi:pimeloyl-ACP methyl ester carboxylesterase